jgi:sulfur relay (sulfurtransferase) DsrF/TusC family protein
LWFVANRFRRHKLWSGNGAKLKLPKNKKGGIAMAKYLFIESRDPFDSSDSEYFSELVQGISNRGNEATLFLVQNGVLPLRRGSKHNETISNLIKGEVKVLADGFSLKERGINKLVEGVETSDIDRLVELLLEPGIKAIWH